MNETINEQFELVKNAMIGCIDQAIVKAKMIGKTNSFSSQDLYTDGAVYWIRHACEALEELERMGAKS